jgi:hypothetical protein
LTNDLVRLGFGHHNRPNQNQVKSIIPEHVLNAEDVRHMMLKTMEMHLSLKTEGYRSSTYQTMNLLLKRQQYRGGVCRQLRLSG